MVSDDPMKDWQSNQRSGKPNAAGEPRRGPVYARALRAELLRKPRNVLEIAAALRLRLREVEVDGFDGALIRARNLPIGAILVRKSIPERGRKYFTIAHEIGHFILHGHDQACTSSEIGYWSDGATEKNLEREANEFAAELLMPTERVEHIAKSDAPSIDLIERIARDFGTSLSAAALRYCEVTQEKCAVVWSKEGVIQWAGRSAAFPFFIPKDKPVEPGTLAAIRFAGEMSPYCRKTVPASLWTTAPDVGEGAELEEESRALPQYHSVMSLLWIRDLSFPTTIEVEVSALDYGHTRTFGWAFRFVFERKARRYYSMVIGRGNRVGLQERVVFNLPPDFAQLSRLDQARVLVREYARARRASAPEKAFDSPNLDVLYGLDEGHIREEDLRCHDHF